jgi:pteridine reductase
MTTPRPTALITGGAKRVGRQIALTLAEAGYDLAITYNTSRDEAEEVVSLLNRAGAAAVAISADLTDPAAIDPIAKTVRDKFGRLDLLVNNASIYEPSGLADFQIPRAQAMWAIHVQTPLLLCRAFEKDLRAAHGHVVNMVDLMAEKPMPSHAVYCASKAALWNLTLSLARELAPEVTVNAIAPGVVEWPAGYPESERENYLRRVPLGRAGTPQDVAQAVLFFCKPNSYVTGQIIRLDGGRSLA